jgi:hypothetical protein
MPANRADSGYATAASTAAATSASAYFHEARDASITNLAPRTTRTGPIRCHPRRTNTARRRQRSASRFRVAEHGRRVAHAPPKPDEIPHRAEDFERRNLRYAVAALVEMDRHFGDRESVHRGFGYRGREERIAVADEPPDIERTQSRHPECAQRRREFVQRQAEDAPVRRVPRDAEETPPSDIVANAARHVARTDAEIGAGVERREQRGNIRGIVRQIRVHRDDRVVVVVHRMQQREHVRGAESESGTALDHRHAWQAERPDRIDRAIVAFVIDDEHVRIGSAFADRGQQRRHIARFVAGRQKNKNPRHSPPDVTTAPLRVAPVSLPDRDASMTDRALVSHQKPSMPRSSGCAQRGRVVKVRDAGNGAPWSRCAHSASSAA